MKADIVLNEALAELQPMLRSGGRSIRVIEADEDTCTIELSGFCGGCECTENYVSGIEEILRGRVPQLKEIRFKQV